VDESAIATIGEHLRRTCGSFSASPLMLKD
jgi:hypothetical protein